MSDYTLEWPDYLAIVLYFVIVLGVGFWASCRAKTDNVNGYFLAGRQTSWIPVGASTFATNIGASMFVGLAGSAASSGIAVVMFEWHAMWTLLLLGWVFLPVYMSSGCYTMPEYLKLRFGGQRVRVWIALVHTLLTIISGLSGQMYAGALFITVIFQWELYSSIIFILLITALYTVIGGLTAVLWTDTIQMFIIVIGSIILAVYGLIEIGGWEGLEHQYMLAQSNITMMDNAVYGDESNRTCGVPDEWSFHIFHPADSTTYPWPGMIFGLTILALNAWCTDQVCVQRSLSSKNMTHAKAGVLLAAYLKTLPFLFFIIPGMIGRALYPEEIACADPDLCDIICQNPSGCTNYAYPYLVQRLLPVGVRGLMMAALLAALMSSLTSTFNSSSTLFTMDLWRRMRPKAKQGELMVVSRMWTLVLVVVSMLWIPILTTIQSGELWDYSQAISSYLVPPIVVTFVLGIFWPRCTEPGAFAGLAVGFVVGVIRMALEWSVAPPDCGSGEENQQFDVVTKVHYLHFAIILALVTLIVAVSVSYLTKPRPPRKLRRVTWWTRKDVEFPDLSDDSEVEEEEREALVVTSKAGKVKYFMMKWLCGVDKLVAKHNLSPEERKELMTEMTDIKEEPKWKKIMDWNAVLASACCFFLHIFWG